MFGKKQRRIEQLIRLIENNDHNHSMQIRQLIEQNEELQKQIDDMTLQAMAWEDKYQTLKHFPSGDE